MKFFKFILVLLIAVSITGCSNNDSNEPLFVLSNDNISGTYNINSFNIETNVTSVTDVAGVEVPFTVATSTSEGDTFQVIFVLNANGSYTASGQYRVVSVVIPAVGSQFTNTEIIDFTDSGSYSLNTVNNTITFTSVQGDFLNGELEVVTFNETSFSLSQEEEEVVDKVTTEIKANISFIRQ